MKLIKALIFILLVSCAGCSTKQGAVSGFHSQSIEEKYAQLLGIEPKNISDKKLYVFIDDWYGTPYLYAGKTKKGVDCSGFASILFREVYGKEFSGSSQSLSDQCRHIAKHELQEGDLVFFKIDSKDVSHCGIYLQNNKFVHSTTKAGVRIDDLDQEYYKKYFEGSGRIK